MKTLFPGTRPQNENVVLSANTSWYLFNFRWDLIKALLDAGYKVTLVAPVDSFTDKLKSLPINFVHVKIANRGQNTFRDFQTFLKYVQVFKSIEPDVVLNFTVKPVIYGSLAARLTGAKHINTITGLGASFIFSAPVRFIVIQLYRVALRGSKGVVFQNSSDLALFKREKIISSQYSRVVAGSGVNIVKFNYHSPPDQSPIIFLYAGRLLKDKGIYELVEAARKISLKRQDIRIRIVGGFEEVPHDASITEAEMKEWIGEGVIDYAGHKADVKREMMLADCVVLPSYREGMSRVLMEAAAIGRPILASDVPGCREAVQPGGNGFLFAPRSPDEIASAITKMAELSPERRQEMGRTSRWLAEESFSNIPVNNAYMEMLVV